MLLLCTGPRAHPRLCGEHASAAHGVADSRGSSPPVRGAPSGPRVHSQRPGLIPACAGSTQQQPARPGWAGAHPRLCGEHWLKRPRSRPFLGSSPPVRGAPWKVERVERLFGLIPACAGSTERACCCCVACWAHPRLCGEHYSGTGEGCAHSGSSPPVRGARENLKGGAIRVGLIPACAGSTPYCVPVYGNCGAHPRLCGEHAISEISFWYQRGSSPPVRGAPSGPRVHSQRPGLIPACAGSTGHRVSLVAGAWAHPRLCGEHVVVSPSVIDAWGSSPPVRGAPLDASKATTGDGLIPACAGSTWDSLRVGFPCRAHPRLCGEHSMCPPRLSRVVGSSPPVRGAPGSARGCLRRAGLIPACAGSTSSRTCWRLSARAHPRLCGEHQ